MGFWKKVRSVGKMVSSPAVWVASGFDGDATGKYIQSASDDWNDSKYSSSAITSDERKFREIHEKLDALDQANTESNTDITKTNEQIRQQLDELKKNPKASKKEVEKNFKEIQARLEANNQRITEQVAKKIDKLEEQEINIAAQIKDAVEKNDAVRVNALKVKLDEVNKKIVEAKIQEQNFVNKKDIDELKREIAKPFYRRVNWVSGHIWFVLLCFCLFIYLIYRAFLWIKGTFTSIFTNE